MAKDIIKIREVIREAVNAKVLASRASSRVNSDNISNYKHLDR